MKRELGGFLLVRTGARRVGLELAQVIEVIQVGTVHHVPSREPAVRGVADVHGRIMPVVHLGALLDCADCPAAGGDLVVVVLVDGRRVCLEIDDAEVVVREAALPVPPGSSLPWAIGVARHAGELVPLLDLTALSSRFVEALPT
ncbi:MAG TPA: chemotaxis protein CheW [Gemmatimonadales bacterium]|nr:chemotaxis protein CheW [Gemmatimonadales bacterium]